MSHALENNPDAIYVPVDLSTNSSAIILAFGVFLFFAILFGMSYLRRRATIRRRYPGMPSDGATRSRGMLALVCLIGTAVSLGLYIVNPTYRADQEQTAQAAITEIKQDFGLEAQWRYVPYNPFDQRNDRMGEINIVAGGRSYPTRIEPTTYESVYDHEPVTRESDETFTVEVLTDSGYVPISQFAQQHAARRDTSAY